MWSTCYRGGGGFGVGKGRKRERESKNINNKFNNIHNVYNDSTQKHDNCVNMKSDRVLL